MVFACSDAAIYLPIDRKPKSGRRMQRLVNIEHQPYVSLLVDHYADDWSQLWWIRVDGTAEALEDRATVAHGHDLLASKYRQYDTVGLEPVVVLVTATRVSSWSAG